MPDRPKQTRALKYAGQSVALVEVRSLDPTKANKGIIIELTEKFVNLAGNAYKTVAYIIFAELVGNVSEHPISGFAALQVYGGKNGRKNVLILGALMII